MSFTAHQTGERNVVIVGNEPEALLLAVLFSEAGVPSYLVGGFEGLDSRNPHNAWDEARWLLSLHKRKRTIVQLADASDLPQSEARDIIVTGHATTHPDTDEMERTVRAVAKTLRKGTNFVFAGLCRPGFTLGILGETIRKYSGMSIGSDVGLSYLPILWNGEQLATFREKPIIMAAVDEKSASNTQDLFLQVFPTITATDKISAAEAAGLFAPIHREVVSALELELATLCQNEQVDYAEAAEICKASGLILGSPRTTASRDAMASMIALSTLGTKNARIIRAAKGVNEHSSNQVLALIKNALALCGRRMRHSKIAILGLNGLHPVAETKNSQPAILQTLRRRGASVSLYPGENTTWTLTGPSQQISVERSISKAVQKANCTVVALDSPPSSELDLQILASEMTHPGVVCDLTRILEASNVERAGLFYTTIGRGTPEV